MERRRIIRGASVLHLDSRRVLKKCDVLVDDGIVVALGGVDPAGAAITEARGVLMPGFVQAHCRLDETFLDRGFVPDVDPVVFLRRQCPAWLAALDEDALRIQAEGAFARGASTGTIAFGDAGRLRGRSLAFDAAAKFGVRLVAGIDAVASADIDRDFELASAELEGRADARLVRLGVWAGDAETTSIDRLKAAARVAARRRAQLFVRVGLLPGRHRGIARLERAGGLNEHLVICHGAGRALTDPGIAKRLAAAGAVVIVSPSFLVISGAPPPPLELLLAHGVRLAIGSESNATRLQLDLFQELRLLYRMLVGRVEQPATAALTAATLGGAHALRIPSGTVSVGTPADLMLLDVDTGPSDDIELLARSIILQGGASTIHTVWVKGRVIYTQGALTGGERPTEDAEDRVRKRVQTAMQSKRRELGLGAVLSALRAIAAPRWLTAFGWHQPLFAEVRGERLESRREAVQPAEGRLDER